MNTQQARPVEILLVEDNPGDVLLTQEAFAEIKCCNRIHVVTDGEQAIDYLCKRSDTVKPDIILLDLNLPKKDGREVLEELKNDPALRRIPVVVLTSSKAEKDIVMSYNLHANCYVVKPIGLEGFSEIVGSISMFWFSIVALPD